MVLLIIFLVFLFAWQIYKEIYYRSLDFIGIKDDVEKYVDDCNELNSHIENLKNPLFNTTRIDYGNSNYYDHSVWNYKRPELRKRRTGYNVHNCSRSVCDNAKKQPFKYICKYFNIKSNEETLALVEETLNNYEAVETGKIAFENKKKDILKSIKNDVPFVIRHFNKKRLISELGIIEANISSYYFPKYIFQYISSGGYASTVCEIILDIENLNLFVKYLSECIKTNKSIAGQRALMTSSLRKEILKRDDYTCKYCKNSIYKERNLLLEVDHIIPLSKGGMTNRENLQTLCWKCNRSKGNKIIDENFLFETKPEETEFTNEDNAYPSGGYLVGRDLPLGGYILKAKNDNYAFVQLYPSYQNYQKEESTMCVGFENEYHISLIEENTYLLVQNADIIKK